MLSEFIKIVHQRPSWLFSEQAYIYVINMYYKSVCIAYQKHDVLLFWKLML